jgi:hypothetical protein
MAWDVVMSSVQLAVLFAISAPFILAVWVAYMHWPRSPTSGGARREELPGSAGVGPRRGRFAAETLELEPEVRAAADSIAGLARENSVRLELAVDPRTTVRVDPIVLGTVLRSLIGTAARSTFSGQVLVTAVTLGTQMHIRIVDDGRGADQTSREIDAREAGEMIALQGGSVAVEVKSGQGTTVTIRLPLPGSPTDLSEMRALAEQEV